MFHHDHHDHDDDQVHLLNLPSLHRPHRLVKGLLDCQVKIITIVGVIVSMTIFITIADVMVSMTIFIVINQIRDLIFQFSFSMRSNLVGTMFTVMQVNWSKIL